MSRARPKHSRKTTVSLAALVLGLAASLGLSSVAWSSTPAPAKPAQLKTLNRQQIQQFLEKDARKTEAATCRGPHRSQFPCRGQKALGGKPMAGQRKLLRSYQNLNDPKCPIWNVKRPWTGYATIATEATVLCVKAIAGHDITGGTFSFDQIPEVAILSLVGPGSNRWNTSTIIGNTYCFAVRVNYSVFVLHVEYAVVCAAHLFVHARVFPPAGRYHGQLSVTTPYPVWTKPLMLNVNSETLCYYC